jgi:hypothetical protein
MVGSEEAKWEGLGQILLSHAVGHLLELDSPAHHDFTTISF